MMNGSRLLYRNGCNFGVSVSRRLFQSSSVRLAKVLATDGVDECCINIFRKRGHEVDFVKTMPESELVKVIGNYDALVVRSATKVTPFVIQAAKRMKIVGRAGVGIDNIDVKESTKNGIMVMNTPGGNTVSTAQLAMSLLCSLARNIPAADMSIKEGKWDRKSFTGIEMNGKTLGVVGCGRIGQEMAKCAKEMGMHVMGYDPVMTAEAFREAGLEQVELGEIWRSSDFITVHTPLTPQTTGLLNEDTLMRCKRGVRIVNCARGGIVDESALLKMLENGQVGGAALDVFTSEPPKEHLSSLIAHPNLVCTPHLGASTDEAQINVARDIATQMCDVFDQKDYFGVVNVSYLAASTQLQMKPFMKLAEIIGAIQAQLSDSPVVRVALRTMGGRDANISTKQARQLLEALVLKGVVGSAHINLKPDLISAPAMAKDVGVTSEILEEAPVLRGGHNQYLNLLSVDVLRADNTQTRVTGAVLGNQPHIVQVDDFSELFAFKPESSFVLSFRNQDRPGVISQVLEVLQSANLNIASMNVARSALSPTTPTSTTATAVNATAETQMALCFMALDDDIPPVALNQLRSMPFLHSVARIQLQ